MGKTRSGAYKFCQVCGKQFYVRPSRIHKALYCSKSCAVLDSGRRRRGKAEGPRVKITCEICGKMFSVNAAQKDIRRFCSRKCRGAWLGSVQKGKSHPGWNKAVHKTFVCIVCGKKFESRDRRDIENETWGTFCSRACQSVYQVGENAPNWQGGLSFEPYGPEFNDRLKAQVRKRDRVRCFLCGEEAALLACHHIDYDKKNNNPWNLVTLCFECHGKTNAHRDMWQPMFEWHMDNARLGYELNNSPLRDCLLQQGGTI